MILNESSLVKDDEVKSWVDALQSQVTNDFSPVWGIDAQVVFGGSPLSGDWEAHILDNADQANALGYHDLTSEGQPLIRIFAQDSLQAAVAVSSVLSHELLETLADPFLDSLVLIGGPKKGRLYAMEVCDPVEGDALTKNGIALSNWVTPAYFMETPPVGAKFDFIGNLTEGAPGLTPGGYVSYMQVRESSWNQSFADSRSKVLSELFK